jgi:hypothetical protein
MAVMPPDACKKETKMKRSEFEAKVRSYTAEPWTDTSYGADQVLALIAQVGVTWDPEESGPEVLWESDESPHDPRRLRFTAENLWELLEPMSSPEWVPWHPVPCITLLANELARRLLAEREHVTGETEIAELPQGDRAAAEKTALWVSQERMYRDLGGDVRSEESAGRRLARIVSCQEAGWWYAKHVGKVFWARSVKHDGGVVISTERLTDFIIEPKDVEYLEFLDLGS